MIPIQIVGADRDVGMFRVFRSARENERADLYRKGGGR